MLTFTVTSSIQAISAGTQYRFRVSAHNAHGWGPTSAEKVIVAASTPDAPTAPVTSIENIYVKIDWNTPASNSAPIDGYYVHIAKSDGVFVHETVYCNGFTSSAVLTNSYCLVPMSVLIASPYNLVRGALIKAKVMAHNEYGDSLFSPFNTVGEKI